MKTESQQFISLIHLEKQCSSFANVSEVVSPVNRLSSELGKATALIFGRNFQEITCVAPREVNDLKTSDANVQKRMTFSTRKMVV